MGHVDILDMTGRVIGTVRLNEQGVAVGEGVGAWIPEGVACWTPNIPCGHARSASTV